MKPFHFEVIATIDEQAQETFELFFTHAPSEAQTLTAALLHLSDAQRLQLVKFSFCQYDVGETGLLRWVDESTTQCKFYFNYGGGVVEK